jgi:hypothetical protein
MGFDALALFLAGFSDIYGRTQVGVFHDMVLRRMFGPKREEVTGG